MKARPAFLLAYYLGLTLVAGLGLHFGFRLKWSSTAWLVGAVMVVVAVPCWSRQTQQGDSAASRSDSGA